MEDTHIRTDGWKTKTYESDKTITTTTQTGDRGENHCPQFGDKQEYGQILSGQAA